MRIWSMPTPAPRRPELVCQFALKRAGSLMVGRPAAGQAAVRLRASGGGGNGMDAADDTWWEQAGAGATLAICSDTYRWPDRLIKKQVAALDPRGPPEFDLPRNIRR